MNDPKQKKCLYCGAVRAESEMTYREITRILRHGAPPGKDVSTKLTGPFCVNKGCGGYYQMGCEG